VSTSPARARFPAWPVLLAAALAAPAVMVLYVFDPARSGFYPICYFHQLTGWQCPGCGALRAMHQLLHGHLAAAFRFNALLVLGLPPLAWFALASVLPLQRRQPLAACLRPAWLWCLLAVVVAFGVGRNLPCFQPGLYP
jgi:hypothetical protein